MTNRKLIVDSHYADEIYNSSDFKKNSQCILLVCNVPAEENLTPIQKTIIQSYRHEWSKKYSDGSCSRLSIIYLSPKDVETDSKFLPFKNLNPGDQIVIIGNYYPGDDYIRSNNIYEILKKNANFVPDHGEKSAYKFDYMFLSNLIIANIDPNKLKISEDEMNADVKKLPIRIKLHACSTALSNMDFLSKEIKAPSIAEKIFDLFFRNQFYNVLIRGRLYDIVPVPVKNDSKVVKQYHKSLFRYFFFDKDADRHVAFCNKENNIGFHVRNMFCLYRKGHLHHPKKILPFYSNPTQIYKMDYVTAITNNEIAAAIIPRKKHNS